MGRCIADTASDRSFSLDFLKIVGTTIIVFHHFQQITGVYVVGVNFWGDYFYWGYIVELFFMLSGYFMYKYAQNMGEQSLFVWYVQRAKRLLPLVAISAVVYELLLLIHSWMYGNTWADLPVTIWGTVITALGIQEGWVLANPGVNNPTWYISVLLACYVVFYLVTKLAHKCRFSPIYCYVGMVLLGIGICTYGIQRPFMNSQVARGYYSFFWGLIIAHFTHTFGIKKASVGLSICTIIGLSAAFVTSSAKLQGELVWLLTFLFYPALIILFETKAVKFLFRHKIWQILSQISFDVYIWHTLLFPCMYLFLPKLKTQPDFSDVRYMFAFTAVAWIVGILSRYLIEKPIAKYVDRKVKPLIQAGETQK